MVTVVPTHAQPAAKHEATSLSLTPGWRHALQLGAVAHERSSVARRRTEPPLHATSDYTVKLVSVDKFGNECKQGGAAVSVMLPSALLCRVPVRESEKRVQ